MGEAIVVLNRTNYVSEVKQQLDNKIFYEKLDSRFKT